MTARPHRSLLAVACTVAGALAPLAAAQWSHDPSVNLGVSTRGSDQNQAKLLPTADGGTWVVWLDGIGTGWNTVIQRLDANGNKLFPGNGVIVSDTAFSSTQDYGAAIDADGRAIVAYRDDANSVAPVQIKVQKVDVDGTLLWGTGVQVSTASGGSAPHCCATSDGGAVVAWSSTAGAAVLQKVDADGLVQWTAGGVTDPPMSGIYFVNDVASDGAGGGIASYHHQTGGFSSPRHVKAQRFASADGAELWNGGSPLVIFDAGSLQLGAFPALVPDGSGGVVTAWYNVAGTRNAYVQHVNASGTELLAHNGVAVAVDVANRIRISAAAAYDAPTGDIYVIARESSASPQGNYSIIAQRIDATGARLWAATGALLIPPGASQPGFELAQAVAGGGAMLAWYNGGFNAQNVFAQRLDAAASQVWAVTPSTVSSGKARLTSTLSATSGALLLSWGDNRTDGNDIYAQRVNLDGTLGTPGDVNDDGVVDGADLGALLGSWGACSPFCAADLNGDGVVDGSDLGVVLGNWS